MIEQNFGRNITFYYNRAVEFVLSMICVTKYDELDIFLDNLGYSASDEDLKLCEEYRNNVSNFIWNEIRYFSNVFNLNDILMAFIIDFRVESIEELIKVMEKSDTELFFRYIGGCFNFNHMKVNHEKWDDVYHDLGLMKKFVKDNIEDDKRKSDLLEMFDNADEVKDRLIFTTRNIYNRVFCKIEDSLNKRLEGYIEVYRNEFDKNPKKFIEKYLSQFYGSEDRIWIEKSFEIHISFFQYILFSTNNIKRTNPDLIIFGVNNCDYYDVKEKEKKVNVFIKALSDKKKVSILRMISKRPYYGYEIAEKLSITPATANYHINNLIITGIVDVERRENKVYLTLNKEIFKDMMRRTEEYILGV